jgi:hypothetical protein
MIFSPLKNESALDWLLEENQPSMKYLALTELLGKSGKDPDVESARENITKSGWAKDILGKQRPSGYWIHEENLYWPKYTSTNWMLLILSDLGIKKEDPMIAKACQTWMERLGKKDGGFNDAEEEQEGELCITANMTRALVKFGYEDHMRVTQAFDWIVRNQFEDGGWDCFCRGKGYLDSWEPLSAFAAYPSQLWTRSMKSAVERGAEFYLSRELHKEGERYEPWYRFHYPVHYYYDLLVGLDFMTRLGYTEDKRLGYAISLLKEKRRSDGKWILDSVNPDPDSPQGREDGKDPNQASTPFALEKPGEPSKIITLRAMLVLKRLGEIA